MTIMLFKPHYFSLDTAPSSQCVFSTCFTARETSLNCQSDYVTDYVSLKSSIWLTGPFTTGPLSCPLPTFLSILALAILFIFFSLQKKKLKKLFLKTEFSLITIESFPLSFRSSHTLFPGLHFPVIPCISCYSLLLALYTVYFFSLNFSLTPTPRGPIMCICVFFSNCIFDSPLAVTHYRGKGSCLNHSPLCSFPPSTWECWVNICWWVNELSSFLRFQIKRK